MSFTEYKNIIISQEGQKYIRSEQKTVAISSANEYVVGIKEDGTVVFSPAPGVCRSSGNSDAWTDLVAISAGGYGTIGLKKDGSIVYAGSFDYIIPTERAVAISKGYNYYVILKEDGTVEASTSNLAGNGVSSWKNIVAVSAGGDHIVGLKKDGSVVAVGKHGQGRYSDFVDVGQCDVSSWKDIIAISAGKSHTVGLKKDGTVVATGSTAFSACEVSDWKDIVSVSAGNIFTVGLKKDGTVVSAGGYDSSGYVNSEFLSKVNSWTDIIAISAGNDKVIGLKKDGSVVITKAFSRRETCDVSNWKLF